VMSRADELDRRCQFSLLTYVMLPLIAGWPLEISEIFRFIRLLAVAFVGIVHAPYATASAARYHSSCYPSRLRERLHISPDTSRVLSFSPIEISVFIMTLRYFIMASRHAICHFALYLTTLAPLRHYEDTIYRVTATNRPL
jgi:hypothetical protein